MAMFVDLVKNDIRRGVQIRVGRVIFDDETLSVQADDKALYELVSQPVVSPDTGEEISPQTQPREYIESLHRVYGGSFVFATKPYKHESESRFRTGDEVELANI